MGIEVNAVCLCMCTYCAYVCLYVYRDECCVCTYACVVFVYVCVCIYVCVCVCMLYACVYMYTEPVVIVQSFMCVKIHMYAHT